MILDSDSKKFIIKVARMFNENLVKQLNKNFTHISKRFDDAEKRMESIERRLESIDGRLNAVNKDTEIIPKIFTMLEDDGIDIAELVVRVDKLDSD